jgi:hypothetical protein
MDAEGISVVLRGSDGIAAQPAIEIDPARVAPWPPINS